MRTRNFARAIDELRKRCAEANVSCDAELDDALELARLADATRPCAYCSGPNPHSAEFCSDRCRGRHYREHAPAGVVKGSRSLASGGWSVTVHFPEGEATRGASFRVKDRVYLGV